MSNIKEETKNKIIRTVFILLGMVLTVSGLILIPTFNLYTNDITHWFPGIIEWLGFMLLMIGLVLEFIGLAIFMSSKEGDHDED